MAIHYDNLPTDKPISLPDPGTYYATIEKAEMKQPKDANKPDYLNMQLQLKDKNGKSAGKIFDILSESEHELVKYKISRFIKALKIDFSGSSFELKDLCKVIVGKQLIVDTTIEESEQYGDKAKVDIFSGEIYYPMDNAEFIFGGSNEDELPYDINAEDAEDVVTASSSTSEEDF